MDPHGLIVVAAAVAAAFAVTNTAHSYAYSRIKEKYRRQGVRRSAAGLERIQQAYQPPLPYRRFRWRLDDMGNQLAEKQFQSVIIIIIILNNGDSSC